MYTVLPKKYYKYYFIIILFYKRKLIICVLIRLEIFALIAKLFTIRISRISNIIPKLS